MVRHGASLVEGKWWGNCAWCEKPRWLQCCHIEPVGQFPALRYDPDNAFAGCYYCHMHRWHKSPRMAENFIVALIGSEKRAAIALRAQTVRRADLAALRLAMELEWKARANGMAVPS